MIKFKWVKGEMDMKAKVLPGMDRIDIYGFTLEAIQKGLITAENAEELKRLVEAASAAQKQFDEAVDLYVQAVLSGKTDEAVKEFHNKLQAASHRFLSDLKRLKVRMTPSTSENMAEIKGLLELIASSVSDPEERAEAQRIKEILSDLEREGL